MSHCEFMVTRHHAKLFNATHIVGLLFGSVQFWYNKQLLYAPSYNLTHREWMGFIVCIIYYARRIHDIFRPKFQQWIKEISVMKCLIKLIRGGHLEVIHKINNMLIQLDIFCWTGPFKSNLILKLWGLLWFSLLRIN